MVKASGKVAAGKAAPARKQVMKAKAVLKQAVAASGRPRTVRGSGLKFALETYDTVSRFTPETRIQYGPNRKTPGSKSYDRFERYRKAKTVGEALKFGTKPADLLWELERGHYKILGGPRRKTPNCMDKGEKTGVEKVLAAWRGPRGFSLKMSPEKRLLCERLAKEFGYDLDQLHDEAEQCCNNESSDVQTQRTLANALAGQKLSEVQKAGRKVRDADVTEVLQAWGFVENATRLNVLPEGQTWVYSDTLGVIRLRTGGFRITDPTTRYPDFTKLLCRWFADNAQQDVGRELVFTAINVNANYAGRRHRDNNNEGPSAIKALGKFKGGRLRYWPRDRALPRPKVESLKSSDGVTMDIRKKFVLFNGKCAHEVESFTGERFSLVFFVGKGYQKTRKADEQKLRELGVAFPTPAQLDRLKKASKELDSRR